MFVAIHHPIDANAASDFNGHYGMAEVSTYRESNTYPSKDGYVFAGWYQDAAFQNPVTDTTPETGAYAKFVDADVLTVRCQLKKDTLIESPATELRVITSVDSLEYQEVGFEIKAGGKQLVTTSKTVYNKIYGYVDETQKEYVPEDVFSKTDSKYFMTKKLVNIPRTEFDQVFQITPFWTTMDGTKVHGTLKETTLSEEMYAPDSLGFIADEGVAISQKLMGGETVVEAVLNANDQIYFQDVLSATGTRGNFFSYDYQYVVFDMYIAEAKEFLFNTSTHNIWTNGSGYDWSEKAAGDLTQGDFLCTYKGETKDFINREAWYTVRMKVDADSPLVSIQAHNGSARIYLKNLTFVMKNTVSDLKVQNIKEGGIPSPSATTTYGDAKYVYATEKDGLYYERTKFEFGPCYVKAIVEESAKYEAAESVAVPFYVGKFNTDSFGFVAGEGTTISQATKDGQDVIKAVLSGDGKQILFKNVMTEAGVKEQFFTLDYKRYQYVTFDMFIETSGAFLFNTSSHNIWTDGKGYDWSNHAAGDQKQGDYLRTYLNGDRAPITRGQWYTVSMRVESYSSAVSISASGGEAVVYLKNLKFEKEFPKENADNKDVVVDGTTYQEVPTPSTYDAISDSVQYTTYYFDSVNGNDANDGLSEATPKQSVAEANRIIQSCRGDVPTKVLFKAGSYYTETLKVDSFIASEKAPLLIDVYGVTETAQYATFSSAPNCVEVTGSNVRISGLELTCPSAEKGFYVHTKRAGALMNVVLQGNYIHDINFLWSDLTPGNRPGEVSHDTVDVEAVCPSSRYAYSYGGIYFSSDTDDHTGASWFENVWVEENKIERVSRVGIFMTSSWIKRPGIEWGNNRYYDSETGWYPHRNINVLNNHISYTGGDALALIGVEGGFIQGNVAYYAQYLWRTNYYGVAIWSHSCRNLVFQYNEAAHTYVVEDYGDGQGFDIDIGNSDILFQYNYSHHNDGGGLLICNRPSDEIMFNEDGSYANLVDGVPVAQTSYCSLKNIIIRNNVFADNGDTAFHIQGKVSDISITNNTIVIPGTNVNQGIIRSNEWCDASVLGENLEFVNNIFYLRNKGVSRFELDFFPNAVFENNVFYNFEDTFLTAKVKNHVNSYTFNPGLDGVTAMDGIENMKAFVPSDSRCYTDGKSLAVMAKVDSENHSAISKKYIGAFCDFLDSLGFVAGKDATTNREMKDGEVVIKAELPAGKNICFKDVMTENGAKGKFFNLGYRYVTFDMYIESESSANFLFNTSTHNIWTNGDGFDWSNKPAGTLQQGDFLCSYLNGVKSPLTKSAWYTVSMKVEDYSTAVSIQAIDGSATIYLKNLVFSNAFPTEVGQPDSLGFKPVDASMGSNVVKVTEGDFANTMKFTASGSGSEWDNYNRVTFEGIDCAKKTGLFYDYEWDRVEFQVYFTGGHALIPICATPCWWSTYGHNAGDANLWTYLTVKDANGNSVQNVTSGQWYTFSFSATNASELSLGFQPGAVAYFKNLRFTK